MVMHTVEPAGDAKIGLAQLQGLKKQVVTGLAANTAIALVGVKAVDHIFSVIGMDGDHATLANTLVDVTANCTLEAVALVATAVTKSGVLPVTVTSNAHGCANGDHVAASGFVGSTELNGKTFLVDVVDANIVRLRGTASDHVTNYASGGVLTTKRGRLKCSSDTSTMRLMVETMPIKK